MTDPAYTHPRITSTCAALVAALVERATGRPRTETLDAVADLPPAEAVELTAWAADAARRLIPDTDVLPDNLPDLIRAVAAGYCAHTAAASAAGPIIGQDAETAGHAALATLAGIFDVELDQ